MKPKSDLCGEMLPGSKLIESRSTGRDASSRSALVTISLSAELAEEDLGVSVVFSEISEVIWGELTSKTRE